jgi:hypothetical protein
MNVVTNGVSSTDWTNVEVKRRREGREAAPDRPKDEIGMVESWYRSMPRCMAMAVW